MPVTLPAGEFRAGVEGAPNRKRFTRVDCEFLKNNGLLTGRYELINGDVISKLG